MNDPTKCNSKVNIFALPNQTSVIFGLVITVFLGAVLLGSFGSVPIPTWPLAIALLLLPLRAFLARPERECARHKLVPAGEELALLQQEIATQAAKVGLKRRPQLVINPNGNLLYTFGSFRHQYIAITRETALKWQQQLTNPDEAPVTQARLIHELYHFRTGDYWQLGYIRELLRFTALLMLWIILFFTAYGFLLILATPTIFQDPTDLTRELPPGLSQILIQLLPSATEMEAMRQKAAEINLFSVITFVVSATLPFFLIGSAVWVLYWPKLWRVREFYADAGVVHTQKEIIPYYSALTGISLPSLRKYPFLIKELPAPINKKLKDRLRDGWQSIRELRKKHPSGKCRLARIVEPFQVFDSWAVTALLVGGLTLLLDILLASPLTLIHIGAWPMHFVTLVILVVVSLGFIPRLVLGRSVWGDMLKIVGVVMAIRLAWLLLTIGLLFFFLIFAPGTLSDILDSAVSNIARYAGPSDGPAFSDLAAFVAEASLLNLVQVFIVLVVLVISLTVTALLLRRLLTWYRFPQANRWLMRIAYIIIGITALIIGLFVLPPITVLLLRPAELTNLSTLTVGALGLFLAVIGLALFFYTDRKYGRYCPACNKPVTDYYCLGNTCQICGAILHPWLLAEGES